MSKVTDKIKVLLQIAKRKFGSIRTEDKEIFFDGDEIAEEKRVYDEAGEPIPDGEYVFEDKVVVVKESVVTEIRPKEETEEKKVEGAEEETTTEEIKEEISEGEPSLEDRVSALEELAETLFEEIRQLKVKETEQVSKNEEIIREFNALKRTPTATSVTKTAGQQQEMACESKTDRLKRLRESK